MRTHVRRAAGTGLLVVLLGALLGAGPARAAGPDITVYTTPTPASGPCVVAAGPDGAAWAQEGVANRIARIDPVTGSVREYPIPWTVPALPAVTLPNPSEILGVGGVTPVSCAIEPGADGAMYFSNGLRNQIGRLDPATGVIDLFTAPNVLGNLQPLNDITPTADAIWFTQTAGNTIGRFDLVTRTFTDHPVPTPASMPVGIFAASDGGVWFTEAVGNKIGRIDPATGAIAEFPLPTPLAVPFVIRAETDGRYLWFTEMGGNKIGRIDMVTASIVEFPVPTPLSLPTEICAGDAGEIWFTHLQMNTVGRLQPSTGAVTEISLPGSLFPALPIGLPPTVPVGISCKPGNAVWFTQALTDRVGRIDLG